VIYQLLRWGVVLAAVAASVASAGHALLWKRDPRAALGWIVVSLTVPVAGPLLYFVFGINRIRTKAQRLPISRHARDGDAKPASPEKDLPVEFSELAGIAGAVSLFELTAGNRV
jgi:cardiolipin synthase